MLYSFKYRIRPFRLTCLLHVCFQFLSFTSSFFSFCLSLPANFEFISHIMPNKPIPYCLYLPFPKCAELYIFFTVAYVINFSYISFCHMNCFDLFLFSFQVRCLNPPPCLLRSALVTSMFLMDNFHLCVYVCVRACVRACIYVYVVREETMCVREAKSRRRLAAAS